MGLAVGPDDSAAIDLQSTAARRRVLEMPDAPVWISLPPAMLKSGSDLPEGTRMFAHSHGGCRRREHRAGALGQPLRSAAERAVPVRAAGRGAGHATYEYHGLLREMIAREHQTPNPRDLSGVLTSGTFNHLGTRVTGSLAVGKGVRGGVVGRGSRVRREPCCW
jgi:hypothetical protein